ncbi:MAG: hypothetical protein P4L85_24090 [Paludisphaera borealis]|uniref:DUF6655 family protein n=1 Tax=Paludisphaera borealis TaxID=1387353 RepID=UPI00283F7BE2|nr:DUF6655 family protein [Paludisphaera borealis]MDR3622453.1 hypothetical protein [Paludisphaera borealis]
MSRFASLATLALAMALSGCVSVTTKLTGSARSGAEQLLLTGTADRAIASIDFRPLAGRKVFLETGQVSAADSGWLVFGLRREMARQGLLLVADKKDAQTVVEAAVGAYGTDEIDSRVSLPTSFASSLVPIPIGGSDASGLIRKNRQDSVVKLALFGYDAATRQLAWESDTVMEVGRLDRRFIGTTNVTRQTSLPELETYPPRRVQVR